MSEQQTSDPHGGLSASGRTADEMGSDEQETVTDYGNTGQEVAAGDSATANREPDNVEAGNTEGTDQG
jgi:hypothetical protein